MGQKHIPSYAYATGLASLKAGIFGEPDVMVAGGAQAVGKIVCTNNFVAGDTFTFNNVTFTCMASGAAGELQFDVGGSLSLSLDALITKLNACTDARVSYATYSKTDTNTAVTSTSDGYSEQDNYVTLASTHSTVVITQPTGGKHRNVSLETVLTLVNFPGATTEAIYLPDGEEGQLKVVAMIGSGTANLTGAHIPAANYALNGADALVFMYAGAKWRLLLNDGAVAT